MWAGLGRSSLSRFRGQQAAVADGLSDGAGRLVEPLRASRHRPAAPPSRARGVIGVEPLPLGLGEQAELDAGEVDRRQGQGLELEIAAVGALDLRPRAPPPGSRCGCRRRRSCSSRARWRRSCRAAGHVVGHLGDAVRALVHREIAADAVAGAVIVVEPACHSASAPARRAASRWCRPGSAPWRGRYGPSARA